MFPGRGPYAVDVYHPTKCIVEHATGNYVFDDQWHVPAGGPGGRRTDCVDSKEITANDSAAKITMDEVVYAFLLPKNGSFNRWILTLDAYLSLDVMFRENRTEGEITE